MEAEDSTSIVTQGTQYTEDDAELERSGLYASGGVERLDRTAILFLAAWFNVSEAIPDDVIGSADELEEEVDDSSGIEQTAPGDADGQHGRQTCGSPQADDREASRCFRRAE